MSPPRGSHTPLFHPILDFPLRSHEVADTRQSAHVYKTALLLVEEGIHRPIYLIMESTHIILSF
jgi:hypothetical protein